MKKMFVVLVAIVLVASFASAQSVWGQGKMSAGVGVELGLPSGDWGNAVSTGIGGFGLFQYGINEEYLSDRSNWLYIMGQEKRYKQRL